MSRGFILSGHLIEHETISTRHMYKDILKMMSRNDRLNRKYETDTSIIFEGRSFRFKEVMSYLRLRFNVGMNQNLNRRLRTNSALECDDSMLVDKAGKTYFNFFISYILYMGVFLGVMIGSSVFVVGGEKWASIGYIIMMSAIGLIILLGILMVIFKIVGAFRYMRGDVYMPPLSIRILKV